MCSCGFTGRFERLLECKRCRPVSPTVTFNYKGIAILGAHGSDAKNWDCEDLGPRAVRIVLGAQPMDGETLDGPIARPFWQPGFIVV